MGLGRIGIFDPFGLSKGNLKEMQTKEIKNGRCASISHAGLHKLYTMRHI